MYNFVLDKDGNIVGHSDPEFANFQAGGVTIYPDPAYRPDEDNLWAIKSGKMVHRSTGLTPEEENQKELADVTGQVMQIGNSVDQVGKQLAGLTASLLTNGGNK